MQEVTLLVDCTKNGLIDAIWRDGGGDGLKDSIRAVDRVSDSLARTCVIEKERWFPGLLQVFDLQSPHADMPWLDTRIESRTSKGC